jgi:RTX calcium-binding nonapeptide repeat (4 copies)
MGHVLLAVRRVRAWLPLAVIGCLVIAVDASAHGVLSREGDALQYVATNKGTRPDGTQARATLTISTPETGTLEFQDTTSLGQMDWGPCIPLSETMTRCTPDELRGVARIVVDFDENDDSATMDTTYPVTVNAGAGSDTISGSYGDDSFGGGPGSDTISGGPGSDTLSGDEGDDSIDAADGLPDTISCGDGADTVNADLMDPQDLTPFGCESVTYVDRPPDPPPPDLPPDTQVTKGPARETHKTTASFEFTATEPGSTFECSRDGSPYRPCNSPKRYANLGRGIHSFKVRATDSAGQTDPTTAKYRWKVKP